jgi:N-acetyl-alpha-D-muramate 1-phosphate uridylyltransferase
MKAMILAAGRGERLRPLTDRLPKALVPVAGTPLIVWHLRRLSAAGITDVVINLCWLGERIEAALGDGQAWGVRIRYSREAVALETAGGIATALPLLGAQPFLVLNGDVFCDADLEAFVAPGLAAGVEARLLLVNNPPHHPAGDFGLDATVVTDAAPRLTYAGIGLYHPALFAGLLPGQAAALGPLLRARAGTGQLAGARHDGRWADVGTLGRLRALEQQLAGEPVA